MIKDGIAKVVLGEDLRETEMMAVMEEVMEGVATPAQIAAFITALRIKGETVEEVTGAARIMRQKATRIDARSSVVVDTCGTGGDGPEHLQHLDNGGLRRRGGGPHRGKARQPGGIERLRKRRRLGGTRRQH